MSLDMVFQEVVVGLYLDVAYGIQMIRRFWSQVSVSNKLYMIVCVMALIVVLALGALWLLTDAPSGTRGLVTGGTLFILLFGITGLGLAVSLSRNLSRRIHELKEGAIKFGQGHLDIKVPVHSNDDLGVLAITLNRMADEIKSNEKTSRLKSLFLANMSHELRTPLGAILGFAKLLREPSVTEEERAQYISIIEKTGESLTKVINDILDLSKIEAGHLEVEKSVFSLETLLEDVVELCKEKIQSKQLEIRLVTKDSLPDLISTDHQRLQQILMDVVGNAIKFTERGVITISCEARDKNLTISVSDTGLGIAADEQELLFRNFSQVDGSLSRRHEGAGLGLALSRRLAQMLGGNVILSQSREGIGSTFTISVPFERPTKEAQAVSVVAEKENPPPHIKGKSILLVDDSEINRLLIEKILSKEGMLVSMAVNGREAIDMALQKKYDVILMDVQMPVMDGRTATQELRSSGYNLPIIALTAHALKEDRDKCLEAGCNDYLTKPVQFEVLFSTIAKYTEPLFIGAPPSSENTLVILG